MKTYIWSFPTRILHWLLAVGFTFAYISGQLEVSLTLHAMFGVLIFTVVILRIIWGFIGPKYSRFSDFPISPNSIMKFLSGFKDKTLTYAGHNPMASLVMLSIFLVGLITAFSGMMLASTEGYGFLFLQSLGGNEELLEEMHEIFANIFLILVGFHLLGLIVDSIKHKSISTPLSMMTGNKSINAESITLSNVQRIYSFFAIFAIIAVLILSYLNPVIENESNKNNQEQEQSEEDDD